MIIVMQRQASDEAIESVVALIQARGLQEHVSRGEERTIIGAVGDERVFHPNELENLPGVERAIRVLNEWRIISRETQPDNSVIYVRGVGFGQSLLNIGSIDANDLNQLDSVGLPVGPQAYYIDPFYLPNRPYASQHSRSEKEQIAEMKRALMAVHDMNKPLLVRIRDVRQIEWALNAEADILYLGGDMMTNRALQDEVGRLNTPVVLCKDKHHRVDDWLLAAEHVALKGNHHIILGEAGTLSFEPEHTYRLDVDAIVRVKRISHLPVIANVTRLWHSDMPQDVLYRLAVAAGVDGIINQLAS